MNKELSEFAARLRQIISSEGQALRVPNQKNGKSWNSSFRNFESLALELFALQFKQNSAYRKMCETRGSTPDVVEHWTQISAVPTAAFKELELSSIPPEERTIVFHSSGTTEQIPSHHFHNAESLAVYEASLWKWFQLHFGDDGELVFLTPDKNTAPRSSLVHMFETVRQMSGLPESAFAGNVSPEGSWTVDFAAIVKKLQAACDGEKPLTILGTAFSFVHLIDFLAENDLRFELPDGSHVMETGGYKNRSRIMLKSELHALISKLLGITSDGIMCEYGMSELSSQAYDCEIHPPSSIHHPRAFRFPPWARAQVISPETGREVTEDETGLIRVFDLANVFSVAAVQTEDLGVRRGDGFELIGRAPQTEPRGCSLMTA